MLNKFIRIIPVLDKKTFIPSIVLTIIWCVISIPMGVLFTRNMIDTAKMNSYALESFNTTTAITRNVSAGLAVCMAFVIVYAIITFVVKALQGDKESKDIIKLFCLFFVLITSCNIAHGLLCGGFRKAWYSGDEANIFYSAILKFPFFFVYTSELFLTSIFVFPCYYAPVLLKALLVAFTCSWILYTSMHKYNSISEWRSVALFIFFCVWIFMQENVRIHRMHFYASLYLLVCVKLFFDSENKSLVLKKTYLTVILMSFLLVFLSVWRREGFYLLLTGPLVLLFCYDKYVSKKYLMIIYISCVVLIVTPLIVHEKKSDPLSEKYQTYHSFIYWMIRESSFDYEKNKHELDKIDAVLNVEKIKLYWNALGNKGYDQNYWLVPDVFEGKFYNCKDCSRTEYSAFKKAVVRIVLSQPWCFIKSRMRAFLVRATQNSIYNLFVPLCLTFMTLFHALLYRKKVLFLLALGVLAHTGVTVLFMPTNYFKYFYHMYLFGYVFACIELLPIIFKKDIMINT